MGSGGSKLDSEREALPARLRPFFRRKLEEIRMHKTGGVQKDTHTISKKMLLNHVPDDDNSSHVDEDEHKSSSSLEDSAKVAPAPNSDGTNSATTVQESQNVETKTGSNKLCQAVSTVTEESLQPQVHLALAFYDEKTIHPRKDDQKGEEARKVKLNVPGEHKEAENGEENANVDEEKGRLVSGKDERCLYPGSPSFRVYFQESLDNANVDDEGDDRDEETPAEEDHDEMIESVKSSDEECLSSTDEKSTREEDKVENGESETSNEESEPNKKNKVKKNRFRKAIPKPGAVKNLLNVTCYYPSCAGHHHKAHLLEKTVA